MARWTPDLFRQRYGDLAVELKRPRAGERRASTVRDYFDQVHEREWPGQEPWYLADWQLQGAIRELRDDYTIPEAFRCWTETLPEDEQPCLRWLYIGPVGSGKPLHVDVMATAAWNAVIAGRKRWRFYPPDGEAAVEIVQSAGDLVYTPSGWPHEVENLEACISVTENFINELDAAEVAAELERRGESRWLELLSVFRARL
jgi:hypothetical protein